MTFRHPRTSRRGILTMELVMTLPILGVVLFAMFEFSMLFYGRADVVEASRAGTRVACLQGATEDAVEDAVWRALKPAYRDSAQVSIDLGEHSGDWVRVGVSVPMNQSAPNLLWPIGYDLSGRNLYAESRMMKE